MKKIFFAVFAAVAVLLSSCNKSNNNEDVITSQNIPACVAHVSSNEKSISYQGVNLSINLNYTTATAEVTITGVKLPDGSTYPAMTFTGLRFSADEKGWYILSAPTAIRPDMGSYTNVPSIDRFKLMLLQRQINVPGSSYASYDPALLVEFNIDGKYNFSATRNEVFVSGTTTTVSSSTSPFTCKSTIYDIAINPEKSTVSMQLIGARFVDRMPAMTFVLKDIPCVINEGSVSFASSKIIPMFNNTPNEDFPISDLQGVLDFVGGLTLDFKCNPEKYFPGVTFEVNAKCTFLDFPTTEE